MKGDKAVHYLASRVGQLELDKSLLLAQIDEYSQLIEQLKKEVESWQQQPNQKDGE